MKSEIKYHITNKGIISKLAINRVSEIHINIFDNGQINTWYNDELIYNGFSENESEIKINEYDDGVEPPVPIYKLGSMFKTKDCILTIIGMYLDEKDEICIITSSHINPIKLEEFKIRYRNYIGIDKFKNFIEAIN